MKQSVSDTFKVVVLQSGDLAHGLSEYTSRHCRAELIEAIHKNLKEDLRVERARRRRIGEPVGRKGIVGWLADYFDVSNQTIRDYLDRKYHPSNRKADQLIKLAFETIPDQAVTILEEDMETHRLWFESASFGVQRGGLPLKRVEDLIA